jgi:hypothetical protein
MKSAYRKDVKDFLLACEALLSPVLAGKQPMTEEECKIVKFYLKSLNDHCERLGYEDSEAKEPSPVIIAGYPT